jgi:hypothetical protein
MNIFMGDELDVRRKGGREIFQGTFRNSLACRDNRVLIHGGITMDIPISGRLIPTKKFFPVAWCHGDLSDLVCG